MTKQELSLEEMERYQNQISLCEMGVSGQSQLKAASVAVIGAGGLGCASLHYLASAGVGRIGIVDSDSIELSNLPRQILYQDEDIGKLKCEVALERLSRQNSHIRFESYDVFLDTSNSDSLIQDYDIVIDATDNFESRYVINDACVRCFKPFIYGGIDRFEGQVAIFNALNPDGIRGHDIRFLYPIPPPDFSTRCALDGVIGALVGVVGSIQAFEAIKLILGIENLSGKILKVDAKTWVTKIFQLPFPHSKRAIPFEISVKEINLLLSQSIPLTFVDIREEEAQGTRGMIHIPLSRLRDQYSLIPRDTHAVLCCQNGLKSLSAVSLLREKFQFQKVFSLEGGFEAWLKK